MPHDVLAQLVQESEGEDAADSRVTLAEDVGRGNLASRQSRVKLQEAGLQLVSYSAYAVVASLLFSGGYSLAGTSDCYSLVIVCHSHFAGIIAAVYQ